MTTMQRVPQEKISNPCLIAEWLIEAVPMQHPLWWHYDLRIITLADQPDTPPAYKSYPEATHELAILALDSKANPTPDDPDAFIHLMPINYVKQFTAPTDEAAVQIAETIAGFFTEGRCILEIQGILGAKEINDHYVEAAVKRFNARLSC